MNEDLQKEATRICLIAFKKAKLKFDLEEIRSRKRYAELVFLRRLACSALREAGFSLSEIGRFIHRGHCNVLHLINNVGWAGESVKSMSDEAAIKSGVYSQIRYHERQIEELRRRISR